MRVFHLGAVVFRIFVSNTVKETITADNAKKIVDSGITLIEPSTAVQGIGIASKSLSFTGYMYPG